MSDLRNWEWCDLHERTFPRGESCIECIVADQDDKIERLQAAFIRMESAWRNELESWYRGEPNNPPNKSVLTSLNGKLKQTERQLEAALEALGRLGSAKPLTSSDPGHPARENIRRVAFAKDYLDRIKAMEETDDI